MTGDGCALQGGGIPPGNAADDVDDEIDSRSADYEFHPTAGVILQNARPVGHDPPRRVRERPDQRPVRGVRPGGREAAGTDNDEIRRDRRASGKNGAMDRGVGRGDQGSAAAMGPSSPSADSFPPNRRFPARCGGINLDSHCGECLGWRWSTLIVRRLVPCREIRRDPELVGKTHEMAQQARLWTPGSRLIGDDARRAIDGFARRQSGNCEGYESSQD